MIDEAVTAKEGTPIESLVTAPTITEPAVGEYIVPGFLIRAETNITPLSEWNIEIHDAKSMLLKSNYKTTSNYVRFTVSKELIQPGAGFYFKLEYYSWPFWSKWAWSGDKVMGIDRPYFLSGSGPVYSTTPVIKAAGFPGAIIRLYEAGSGVHVHGEGTVRADGTVDIQVTKPLWSGNFPMTANQTKNGVTSGWANQRNFIVP
ncbi:hypothetical protein ACYZUC_16495 [Pseudomonas sp. GT1P32]